MKLETRRTVRRWLLEAPSGTFPAILATMAGVMLLGIFVETPSVGAVGFLAVLGAIYVRNVSGIDACPNCRSEVQPMVDRYCVTCGMRLDGVEAAPPIDERVDERHRPVGLEEIERSPPVEAIADGGEFADCEEDR